MCDDEDITHVKWTKINKIKKENKLLMLNENKRSAAEEKTLYKRKKKLQWSIGRNYAFDIIQTFLTFTIYLILRIKLLFIYLNKKFR